MKFKKVLALFLGLCMAFAMVGCRDNAREFKNVIVVIGDGMGENHLLNAITYFDLKIPVFFEDQVGYINTDSLDGTTDSAAGGTALATGKKVHNSNVAMLDGENLEQITTIAQNAKMKTGIVTTDTLSGATPASFSAHSGSRGFTGDIMRTQSQSNIDLLIGRSDAYYVEEGRNGALLKQYTDNGYLFADTKEELLSLKNNRAKVLAALPKLDSEYTYDDSFKLKDIAKFAVEFLENDNGFFLMIEGAYIDKQSHSNAFPLAMNEVRSLIDTIAYLYEYAADGETAIFITADHETGALARAENKDQCDNSLYHSGDHSSTPVPLFVKNYEFDKIKFGYDANTTPENTVVFDACKAIITGAK